MRFIINLRSGPRPMTSKFPRNNCSIFEAPSVSRPFTIGYLTALLFCVPAVSAAIALAFSGTFSRLVCEAMCVPNELAANAPRMLDLSPSFLRVSKLANSVPPRPTTPPRTPPPKPAAPSRAAEFICPSPGCCFTLPLIAPPINGIKLVGCASAGLDAALIALSANPSDGSWPDCF